MKKIILLTIFSFTAFAQAPQNLTNVGQINWFGSNQLGPCNWKVDPIAQTITAPCLTSGNFSGNAISLQGIPISAATPTIGQALLFNGTVWAPQTPVFTAGANITITGSWPNLTINSTGVGSGNVTTGGTLTNNNIVTGAGSQAVQDSGINISSLITATNSTTFANKSISGITNSFTNIPNSALVNSGSTTINGTTCTIGMSCSVGASGGVSNFPSTIFSVVTSTASYATGQTPNLVIGSNSSGNVGLFAITPAMLPVASAAAFGAAKCDNTTITCAGGVFTAIGGGGSNATALQGNAIATGTANLVNQGYLWNGTAFALTVIAPLVSGQGSVVNANGSNKEIDVVRVIRKVAGATDTATSADCNGIIMFTGGTAIESLPAANNPVGTFQQGCQIRFINQSGTLTINTTGGSNLISITGGTSTTKSVSAGAFADLNSFSATPLSVQGDWYSVSN